MLLGVYQGFCFSILFPLICATSVFSMSYPFESQQNECINTFLSFTFVFKIKLKSANICSVVLKFFVMPDWKCESMSLLSISFSMRLQTSELLEVISVCCLQNLKFFNKLLVAYHIPSLIGKVQTTKSQESGYSDFNLKILRLLLTLYFCHHKLG